jgi:NAD(P)-dependent dehydrogenase (short-subunit alcohol dehydrogenase family)
MSIDLKGKTVIVTGASRGIGAAAVRIFAEYGARVALLARDMAAIGDLARDIGDTALPLACDVADSVQVQTAFAQVAKKFGPVDILINNAGVIDPIGQIDTVDTAQWGALIDINLKGAFYCVNAALPMMKAQNAGTIINISSGAATNPLEGWSAYCASKAGLLMLTKCIHKEFGTRGIRALGLSPGTVATDMQRAIKASGINPVSQLDWADHIPPDWPAKALVWMCGPGADMHLGQDISLRVPEIRAEIGLVT